MLHANHNLFILHQIPRLCLKCSIFNLNILWGSRNICRSPTRPLSECVEDSAVVVGGSVRTHSLPSHHCHRDTRQHATNHCHNSTLLFTWAEWIAIKWHTGGNHRMQFILPFNWYRYQVSKQSTDMRCLALTDITAASSEGVHLNEEIHRLKRLYTVTHHTISTE